jgi:cephalosporin hydroxylase
MMRYFWKLFYKLSPSKCEEVQVWRGLDSAARSLSQRLSTSSTMRDKAALVVNDRRFGAVQHITEIGSLLEELAVRRPRAVCEIGGANGGTLALFCQVAAEDAILISIDLAYTWPRRMAHRRFARAGQRVYSLRADSHNESTVERVRALLRGRMLDFLLIDGDHSLEGVRRDFQIFGPLVSKQGLVALHDIVPDHSRYGVSTQSVVGGVPEFWAALRGTAGAREIVERPDQDGYGLGIVEMGSGAR